MDGSGYLIWSPSGTKMASIETEGIPGDWYPSIYVLNVSSDQKDLIFSAVEPIATIGSLSWSRDGNILAYSFGNFGRDEDPKPEIFFYEVISETTNQITNDEFQYRRAEFSPTDDLIALQRVDMNLPDGIPKYATVIRDLRSHCEIELPISHTSSASWSPDGEKLVISALGDAYIVDLLEFIGADFKETRSIC
jgi:Tol biopolymer transport system component